MKFNKIIVQGHIGSNGEFIVDKKGHIDNNENVIIDDYKTIIKNSTISEFLCDMTETQFKSDDNIISRYDTFKITIEKPV